MKSSKNCRLFIVYTPIILYAIDPTKRRASPINDKIRAIRCMSSPRKVSYYLYINLFPLDSTIGNDIMLLGLLTNKGS